VELVDSEPVEPVSTPHPSTPSGLSCFYLDKEEEERRPPLRGGTGVPLSGAHREDKRPASEGKRKTATGLDMVKPSPLGSVLP
jgi:hypothetical protein